MENERPEFETERNQLIQELYRLQAKIGQPDLTEEQLATIKAEVEECARRYRELLK